MTNRFWSKVDASGDCWEWTAYTEDGYGRYRLDGGMRRAHRVAWEILIGPIPKLHEIDHLCRNRKCVNPDHLEPVVRAVHNRRGHGVSAINSRRKQCPQGHDYSKENTMVVAGPSGTVRRCRECRRTQQRLAYARGES